jgi:FkbM family methyltransferase
MIHHAPNGRHYAFEPIPDLYRRLVSAFPHVNIYNLALSETVGAATFHHVESNPSRSGLKNLEFNRNESVREISVRTDRLDNIMPRDIEVTLIKIDVEGAELQVLKGAVETLRRCRPTVIFECGLGGSDSYGATPEQIYDLFKDCGLGVSVIEEWLNDGPPLSREGFAQQFYEGLNFYYMAHAV